MNYFMKNELEKIKTEVDEYNAIVKNKEDNETLVLKILNSVILI